MSQKKILLLHAQQSTLSWVCEAVGTKAKIEPPSSHMVSTISPCPMVLPPSLIAKRIPFSIGVPESNSQSIVTSSPGIAICTASPSELAIVFIGKVDIRFKFRVGFCGTRCTDNHASQDLVLF